MNIATRLLNPDCYPHPVSTLKLVETHVSWVVLTGQFAYKIKKPLNLGFLDYSTLEKRHHCCEEELRLNRRLAQPLYLSVEPITETVNGVVRIKGHGAVVEYAVKMRQFAQQDQFDELLAAAQLKPRHIFSLAKRLAQFHQHAAVAPTASPWGNLEAVVEPMLENFQQLAQLSQSQTDTTRLTTLQRRTQAEINNLKPLLNKRKTQGFVRECHGDLHLRNIAMHDDALLIFDCIEFNDNLRWIDVMSELAFTVMDLYDRERADLAMLLLNAYLEFSGDYQGVPLLRFYLVYRAMVRAKVAAIRARQTESPDVKTQAEQQAHHYIELAQQFYQKTRPALIICHGLSGSGKTTYSESLVPLLQALRIRSDIERKRLAGLDALQSSGSDGNRGIYSATMTQKTYRVLLELSDTLLKAGWPVIVDAAFLKWKERFEFRQLAAKLEVPFLILDFPTPTSLLNQRIMERLAHGQDASEATPAVLQQQLQWQEPLDDTEKAASVNTLVTDAKQLSQTMRHSF